MMEALFGMGIRQDVFSFVNALPKAVLLVDRRKRTFAGANAAFFELTGFANDAFVGTQAFDLPFSSREIKRGLLHLFIKVSRGAGYNKTYSFRHVCPNGTIKNISASGRLAVLNGREYIIFILSHDQSEALLDDSDSWKFYLTLAYEPYMEFRPSTHVATVSEPEGRMEFLQKLGNALQVKFFNNDALRFYNDDRGTLEGKSFLSLFNKESDAIGFLDILDVVGRIKGETAVDTSKASGVHVEMNCIVKFDTVGSIMALYCSQRDLSVERRYKDIIGGSRLEMGFMFHQPFIGFAFLVPPQPLERPSIEDLYTKLDEMLNQITVVRANEAMLNMYDVGKSGFFMKPMSSFFSDLGEARQVLKELFVMRETSLGKLKEPGGKISEEKTSEKKASQEKVSEEKTSEGKLDFERVSIFRAVFDNADRLSGVHIATSKHSYGFTPRHITGGANQ